MGLGRFLFGDVGRDSAQHVTQAMQSAKDHVLRDIAQAKDHILRDIAQATRTVTTSLDNNAIFLQKSLHAATTMLQNQMAAETGRLRNALLIGLLAIAGAICAFTVVYGYTKRPLYIQSTIEIEEANGAKRRSHTVMEGPPTAIQEYPRMLWAQARALAFETVQPSVRQRVWMIAGIGLDPKRGS